MSFTSRVVLCFRSERGLPYCKLVDEEKWMSPEIFMR